MPYARKNELHVLDLICGDARVAMASAFVHQGKTIHYLGLDKNQDPRTFGLSTSKESGLKKIFLGKQETKWRKEWEEAKRRLNMRLERKNLNFDKPEELSKQLGQLLGKKKFDEIHFHMPSFSSQNPVEILRVISLLLKPGGRIFHTVEGPSEVAGRSPILDFKYTRDYASNKQKLLTLSKKAGLVLDKSVFVGGEQFEPEYAMPRKNSHKKSETNGLSKRPFEKAVGMLSAYSAWDGLMGFLVVFRKPLRRKT